MALIELNRDPKPRELFWFTVLWFPAFFALVGGIVLWAGGPLAAAAALWAGAGLVSGLGLVFPPFMRLVFLGWMYAFYPIGWTVSHLVLGIIYYGVMTPIGALLRLGRWDPLERELDASAGSYWSRRRGDGRMERYLRQY